MDNLTHSLIGLAVAKAGLERLSPGATTLCVLAANSPDVDIVTLLGGRWTFLQQHRGISHSIVGALVLALALPLVFYLVDLLLTRLHKRPRQIRLPGLMLASLVATATHPVMDWTNNYGIRPLLPWNPRWFYGDFVFIVDPFLWLVLGGAAFLLTARTRRLTFLWLLLALVPSYLVLGARSAPQLAGNALVLRVLWIVALIGLIYLHRQRLGDRAGPKIALAALVLVTIYCSALALTHTVALRQAQDQARAIASRNAEQVLRVAAMPVVANPTEWACVMETDRATYRFELSLRHRTAEPAITVRYEKPQGSDAAAVAEAKLDSRSQVFLGFARFPVAQITGADCATQTLVQFADLRYTEPGRSRGTFALDVPIDCPSRGSGN
jgi:inner membrane protein